MPATAATQTVETAIVGAGQAGLTMSHYLSEAGREHVVFESRRTLGGGWQDRWDTFRLVTPNWSAAFAGYPYDGDDPDGFMPRDEIAARVAGYARRTGAPVRLDTAVTRLSSTGGDGFLLETIDGPVRARNVVVATGAYHKPRVPEWSAELPHRIAQIHSHGYHNERSLPSGAVLIVGSGQSGVQLAEELHEAGRRVYLSVGSAGAVPRKYRGRDFIWWMANVGRDRDVYGLPYPTPELLPDAGMRLMANPQLSGHHGGHDMSLRRMAAAGIVLLGRVESVEGERVRLAGDLAANVTRAEGAFDARFRSMFDRYAEMTGLDLPPDDRRDFDFEPSAPAELDLAEAGISNVLWASGYRPDFGWIDLSILDRWGIPRNSRGVSDVPGLYFLGLPWQSTIASATLFGGAWDVEYLAGHMGLLRSEARAR